MKKNKQIIISSKPEAFNFKLSAFSFKLLAFSFLLLAFSFQLLANFVFAGSLSTAKATISDSRAGQNGTSHTFSFITGTAGSIKTVEMLYCTTPSGACATPNGIITTSASQGSVTGLGASTSTVTTNGTVTLTVTSASPIPSGTTLILPYTNITNPTTINASFFVRITTKDAAATTIDSTTVAFATLASTGLAVSADVSSTFSVALAPVNAGSVNGQAITISSTTATTIPFGTLSVGSSKVAAHDITIITNSTNGYAVTVKASNPPLIDGSNNIDSFTEPNSLPLTWSTPAGSSPNVNTGFLGYTTEDSSLCTGTADRFTSSGGNKWAGFDTAPYELVCNHSAVLSGETTRLGWRAEVNGSQPSGSYAGDIIIVTTPTY